MARHVADILAEIADGDAAIDLHLALVGLLLAGDHAKQSRLAGAVRPDKTDLLTLLQGGRSLDEDDLAAVLLADVFKTDHGAVRGSWYKVEGFARGHTRMKATREERKRRSVDSENWRWRR